MNDKLLDFKAYIGMAGTVGAFVLEYVSAIVGIAVGLMTFFYVLEGYLTRRMNRKKLLEEINRESDEED